MSTTPTHHPDLRTSTSAVPARPARRGLRRRSVVLGMIAVAAVLTAALVWGNQIPDTTRYVIATALAVVVILTIAPRSILQCIVRVLTVLAIAAMAAFVAGELALASQMLPATRCLLGAGLAAALAVAAIGSGWRSPQRDRR